MAGWTRTKRLRVEEGFYQFLNRCFVNSKDAGQICLGEHLYEGQRQVITQIFDALEEDIHDIYILKSRQLGISTIIRALVIFLLGVHKGLKGAIVFDTEVSYKFVGASTLTAPPATLHQAHERMLRMQPPDPADPVAAKAWRLHLIDGWIRTHAKRKNSVPWELCELAGLHQLRALVAAQE
jgi:hypothetical protein